MEDLWFGFKKARAWRTNQDAFLKTVDSLDAGGLMGKSARRIQCSISF